ncbi:YheC/YheD family protein [Peribacillus sp. NPDC097198]|uniref:YheC/YheD family endospore coat-associated protein n=1 Tax=Peribacillus sp. NPDC097198 TaxID=3364397 RepID=UPI00380808B2
MTLKYQKVFITVNSAATRKKALLFVEEKLFQEWDLQYGEPLTLIAGRRSVPVLVQTFASPESTIKISHDTNQFLSLPPFSGPVSVSFHAEERTLQIAPFLAVLINQGPLQSGTFGEMEPFYQEMIAYCNQKGFPFFLAKPQPLADGILTGYWPGANGWETLELPVPDVFYNRIHSRKVEGTPLFENFSSELKSLAIPMFNGRFLSKHDVHELLLSDYSLLPHLPETVMFNEQEPFMTFLDKYPVSYLKPSTGSQGRNICKLTESSGRWVIEHAGTENNIHTIETKEKLFSALKKFCRNQAYILQKGISLFEINQKLVDFRILLHKNGQNQWKVTSMVARIGDSGNIVSNLAQGGVMKNGFDFLKEIVDHQEAKRLYQSLIRLAKKTAVALDDNHPELFGELGIDLALDSNKHPWIIEVNSKPSKKFQGTYETFRPSVKSIIEFMYAINE